MPRITTIQLNVTGDGRSVRILCEGFEQGLPFDVPFCGREIPLQDFIPDQKGVEPRKVGVILPEDFARIRDGVGRHGDYETMWIVCGEDGATQFVAANHRIWAPEKEERSEAIVSQNFFARLTAWLPRWRSRETMPA